jgi:hypothetical protein
MNTTQSEIIENVKTLLSLYKSGKLGNQIMPEETHPQFFTQEQKLLYFTLPMALNYQRDSYKLWVSAKKTWEDNEAKKVFDLNFVANSEANLIKELLLKHKLALQPVKHIDTWRRISTTVNCNWHSFSEMLTFCHNDFLILRELIQIKYKKSFPYLSGPKIFNYWAYILTQYCDVTLKNRSLIEIAPDTHVIQASEKLGVLQLNEVENISRDEVSRRWRVLLEGTGIDPIDVHSPLWFWSRGGFRSLDS